MKRFSFFMFFLMMAAPFALPFCGFFVARAGAELFNKGSQVILTRKGTKTVLTMSNDFQGSVRDFAIVVPVPVVLQRQQIRIAEQSVFDYLDAYTGPRLVEYHDDNPCQPRYELEMSMGVPRSAAAADGISPEPPRRNLGVRIEASYTVGEYDILILSAQHSSGLKTWLLQSGYAIPNQAEEVLEPYIRSNLKFFVVKVNLDTYNQQGFTKLRPLQIEYDSEKFMLPIRLGMANANGPQDLIVYALTERGRVEPVNYPMMEIPTNNDIPEAVQPYFGAFYAALFTKAWERGGQRSLLLEYAWNISSSNYQHCDPCNTTPPTLAELQKAGVFWLSPGNTNFSSTADYQGDVFITRLHARYTRDLYPEDFFFQETPNNQAFQGRYVMRHAATGDLSCEGGKQYLAQLKVRRQREITSLLALTGWKLEGNRVRGTFGSFRADSTSRGFVPLIGGGGAGGGNTPHGPEGNAPGFFERLTPQAPGTDTLPLATDAALHWQRVLLLGLALATMLGLFVLQRRWAQRRPGRTPRTYP